MPGNYGNVNTYFWIGPLIGAVVGAFVYDGLIRNVLRARGLTPDPEVSEQGRTTVE
jgi:glycerol uptake facilitator protein